MFARHGRGRGILYPSCDPAGTKSSRLSPLEDFAPSSCGQPPVSACAQADPVRCPRPGKRCRRKHGSIPSRAYGRRRYNTLDLASKIVCHGNSLFPLDPLGFRSRWGPKLRNSHFGFGSGNTKRPDDHPLALDDRRVFLLRFGFRFYNAGIAVRNQNLAHRRGGTGEENGEEYYKSIPSKSSGTKRLP